MADRNRIRLNRTFDSPYDSRVTDLRKPLMPKRGNGGGGDGFENRNLTNTTPFQLVGGADAIRALPRNPRRVGLRIQNLDNTADLRYSFGNALNNNGVLIPPRSSDLYDFTTPPDEVYLWSSANIYVIIVDITRGF